MASRAGFRFLLLASLMLTVAATPSAFAAWPHDPAAGIPVCTVSGSRQEGIKAVPDDAGGAIVVWQDTRGGTYDIYAQRIGPQGEALWTTNGVVVNNSANDQLGMTVTPDGAHGVIVCWEDRRFGTSDIYAQRLNGSGVRLWATSGVAVCAATGGQQLASIAPDGAGGAFIAWDDYRNGNWDTYTQHLNSSGAPLWRSNGAPACSLATHQVAACVASDMAGGAYVTWSDYRNGASNVDVYAQRILASGAPAWTLNGISICAATGQNWASQIVSDGDLGATLVWADQRSGTFDLYAQHVDANGNTGWGTDGIAVCTASGDQEYFVVAGLGRQGVLLAWRDLRNGSTSDVYAQWLSPGGYQLWTSNGRLVCSAPGDQYPSGIVPDGYGGATVVWDDRRMGYLEQDVYAQNMNAAGVVQWTTNGVCVGGGSDFQAGGTVAADGTGGAIVAYSDYLLDPNYGDISAQRIERFGHLGDPAPVINRVADVPDDQGGQVQVEWTASYLDTFPGLSIAQYSVWRRVPNPEPALLASSVREPSRIATARLAGGRILRTGAAGVDAVYWEQVGVQTARELPGYSFVAGTTGDSMPGSNRYTSFMVMAEEPEGGGFWPSAADSGYSVDNLAPALPVPFTGTYAAGTAYLQWGQSPAPDFAEFRLHRGEVPSFVPGPGNLVVAQASAGYVDAAGAPCFYRLCAVDLHGNASPYAFLQPVGTADIPGAALPKELALSAPAPNPLRGSCTMRLALPREAQVTLAVYDQQGRRVRTLLAGAQPAGERAVVWDGADGGGERVASGIYFVRCEVEGRTFTRRIAAIR